MKTQRGFAAVEYAVVLFVLICAVLAMTVYVKRAIQGQYRGTSDSIGEQYDPKATTSDIVTVQKSSTKTIVDVEETPDLHTDTTKSEISDESSSSGEEHVGPMSAGLFN